MALDDLVRYAQSQSGAGGFGGEERVKYVFLVSRLDTGTESLTLKNTAWLFAATEDMPSAVLMSILPPSVMASMAFKSTLLMTCCRPMTSPRTGGKPIFKFRFR